jgi:DNA polymerase III delta subunit
MVVQAIGTSGGRVRPSSNPAELVKAILAGQDCPLLVEILSPDFVRRKRILNLFLNKFLPGAVSSKGVTPIGAKHEAGPGLALLRMDGRTFTERELRTLRDELGALSLFSKKRFFSIEHVDEVEPELHKALAELAANASHDVRIIISGSKLPESSALKKLAKEKHTLIELEELQGAELKRWIEKELRQAGFGSWEDGVVALITEVGESSPDTIVQDIEHLSLYLESDTLSVKNVEQLFVQRTVAGEFELIDNLARGDRLKAEVQLSSLFDAGKNAFMFLGLLSRTFSNYLAIRSMLDKGLSPDKIRAELGMAPWLFNKQLSAAKNYSQKKLKRAIEIILRADSKLKNRSLGNETIFSELLDGLAAGKAVKL